MTTSFSCPNSSRDRNKPQERYKVSLLNLTALEELLKSLMLQLSVFTGFVNVPCSFFLIGEDLQGL